VWTRALPRDSIDNTWLPRDFTAWLDIFRDSRHARDARDIFQQLRAPLNLNNVLLGLKGTYPSERNGVPGFFIPDFVDCDLSPRWTNESISREKKRRRKRERERGRVLSDVVNKLHSSLLNHQSKIYFRVGECLSCISRCIPLVFQTRSHVTPLIFRPTISVTCSTSIT